ncbi:MAG: LysR family transcriptional regulator [Alphaproteobacteria bacterium]
MDKILRQFIDVADQKSINKAAKILGISQPALSRNMQRLEENFGKPLFHRASSGIELTQYGEVLYRRAQVMELEYQYALEEFKALEGISDGTIRIGSGYDWSLGLLPMITKKLNDQHPNVNFHIQNGHIKYLLNDLSSGRLDIVLAEVIPQGELPNAVSFKPVRDVSWNIFTHKDHPAQKNKYDRLEQIQTYPWAAYNVDPSIKIDARQIFYRNRMKRPTIRYTSNSILTIFHLVQENKETLTSLPSELTEAAKNFGLLPLDIPEASLPYYTSGIYYRNSAVHVPYLKDFIDIFEKEYLAK